MKIVNPSQAFKIANLLSSMPEVRNIYFMTGEFNVPVPSLDPQRIVYWNHIHGLGIDPIDSGILYIATHGELYKSVNGGPPVKVENAERRDYMAFTADPSKSGTVYASGHPSTGGNTGFIKSNNGGLTWQKVSDVLNPPVDFHAIAISDSNPNILYGFDSEGKPN